MKVALPSLASTEIFNKVENNVGTFFKCEDSVTRLLGTSLSCSSTVANCSRRIPTELPISDMVCIFRCIMVSSSLMDFDRYSCLDTHSVTRSSILLASCKQNN